ncbi:hypothetical protein AB6A40_000686 [Gnathostoma spinigerum]|uniref:DNA polymerase n=1 Tax=Gnathostoma spinigerum TaxID=75299 RepID=A0ABD6E4N2_9BILA
MAKLVMRSVTCDYIMEKPNGFSRAHLNVPLKVPVIRLFGILEDGKKCCVHVHGVFPYVMLECFESPTAELLAEVRSTLVMLVLQRNRLAQQDQVENAIYNIEVLQRKSLYGYHHEDSNFLKISFYNPQYVKLFTEVLHHETLTNRLLQVYEAHVPFILQFFIDYSIFGMDLVHFDAVKFRISPKQNPTDTYVNDILVGNIIKDKSLFSPVLPATKTAVECDAFAEVISNRQKHSNGVSSNPGLSFVWNDELKRSRISGRELQYESSQEERPAKVYDNEVKAKKQLSEIIKAVKSESRDLNVTGFDDSWANLNNTVTQAALFDDSLSEYVHNAEVPSATADDFDNLNTSDISTVDDDAEDKDAEVMSQQLSSLLRNSENVVDNSDEDTRDTDDTRRTETCGTSESYHSSRSRTSLHYSQQSTVSSDMLINAEPSSPWSEQSKSEIGMEDERSGLSRDCFELEDGERKIGERPLSMTSATVFSNNSKSCGSEKTDEVCLDKRKSMGSGTDHSDDGEILYQYFEDSMNMETDIETIWNSKRPRRKRLWLTQGSDESLIDNIPRSVRFNQITEEAWLEPSCRLTYRQRNDPLPIQMSKNDMDRTVSPVLQFSAETNGSMKTSDEESAFESWCAGPSFIDYERKLKLDATICLPKEPETNPCPESSDIRHLCVMSLEVLARTRIGLPVPDPQIDPVIGVFCCVQSDICFCDDVFDEEIAVLNIAKDLITRSESARTVGTETELFDIIVAFVDRYDPDILVGYDTNRYSWGYMTERSLALGRNFLSEISRSNMAISDYYHPHLSEVNSYWISRLNPTPRGRLLLNIWRLLRHELALRSYTKSNVIYHILSRRFPELEQRTLTEFIESSDEKMVGCVIRHLMLSSKVNLTILCHIDFFTRTSEMARVYGIQFAEVLSRGSQFRVESMLLRLARLHRFTAPSVSPAQRKEMPAPEILPLNMEPESGIYRDPVIVLDFQSLYPSVVIAYNYCFTTCLGKVSTVQRSSETNSLSSMRLGGLIYSFPVSDVAAMLSQDEIHIAPCGTVFCKKSIRRGIMPLMLEEILTTRVMVKKAAKDYKHSPRLARILDARQLALKLIANVTYGYTAANFSGRMPCVEVADAIVSKGREALENAISMVNHGNYQGARVIYGDTDSLFVLCPGMTRAEAFRIGELIAEDATNANPNPMKLKLEKVMQPLVLQSKKRYVGMSYEKADEKEGFFDAKGIETVRRDSCPIVSKMLEKCLRLLFAEDFPALVTYINLQLSNMNQLPVSDFVFSREYRASYAPTAVVPSKRIAEKRAAICPRDEPEYGERVPYLIVCGEPDSTLISCVLEPSEYLRNRCLIINYAYYVQHQILPSLHRVLDYVPLHIQWFQPFLGGCYGCNSLMGRPWCGQCLSSSKTLSKALCNSHTEQSVLMMLNRKCRSCLGLRSSETVLKFKCINMACLVALRRFSLQRSLTQEALLAHSMFSQGDRQRFTSIIRTKGIHDC